MKNLLLFLILLFAATGCQSDLNTTTNDEALVMRGQKNMVPFHAEVYQWFDLNSGFQYCGGVPIPVRFLFEGEATHMGHSRGWADGYQCSVSPEYIFHGDFAGTYIAANGDELWFSGWVEWNLVTDTFVGSESEFTGGTGRWVNATGSFVTTGNPTETPGVFFYIHEGEVSAPGKK